MATPQAASVPDLLDLPATRPVDGALRRLLAATAQDLPAPHDELPVLVATLEALALLESDGEVVAAAILHAVPAWRARCDDALARDFPAVLALVEGQQAANQVWALHAEQEGHGAQEGLRRLLLAIVRDLRVVPILLARQLARMRAAGAMPEADRRALARLTRDIHAPLANRLGIWQLKWELEDLAFRHLEPATYQRIARLLDDKRAGRERYVERVAAALRAALDAQGVEAEVAGRPKHIYSIWKKMQKKDVPIGELYDLRAVRVLVEDVPACYAALGVVHALWAPVASEFDDYIARPKANDYRSLHTAVVGPEGKTVEVQIRTREMHAQSELGVAAHWRYKERSYKAGGGSHRSGAGDAALNRKIEWMRRLLDPADDEAGAGGRPGALAGGLASELVEDRIYALTPKGEVIDLPQGATPLDFAYRVHTMVGHRCRGAKVDGRIVPLDHVLRSGDRVEILTGKAAEPRRDWLVASNGFLASARSREKVRGWFHKLDRERNLHDGRELLEKELRRLGVLHVDPAPVLRRFNVDDYDDLCVLVALGDVGPHQVGRALLEHERAGAVDAPDPAGAIARRLPRRVPKASAAPFTVVGVDNLLVQVGRCCQPLPGEPVAGYLTRGRGVTVHRTDCPGFLRLVARQPQRRMAVEWGESGGGHEAEVVIDALDRRNLLKDVTNLISQQDAHVLAISGGADAGSGVRLRLRLRVRDFGQLARLLGRIEELPGVDGRTAHEPVVGHLPAPASRRYSRLPSYAGGLMPQQPPKHVDPSPGAAWPDGRGGREHDTPDPGAAGLRGRLARKRPMPSSRRWVRGAAALLAVVVVAAAVFRAPIAERVWPETRAQSLQAAAESALAAGRLTAPDGSGARELFEAALAIDPDRAEARSGLARVAHAALARAEAALAGKDFAGAHEQLALARALSVPQAPADRFAERLRGSESAHAGVERLLSQAEAARQQGRLAGSPEAALPLYRRVLALQPDRVEALRGREDALGDLLAEARESLRKGGLDAAAERIALAREFDRGHVDLPDTEARLTEEADALRRRADRDLRRGRLAPATAAYRQLLALDPEDGAAQRGLAAVAASHASRASRFGADFEFADADAELARARVLAPGAADVAEAGRNIARSRQARARLVPSLDAKRRDARVRVLLEEAAAAEARGDLLAPPGDSAFDKLRAARALAPDAPAVRAAAARLVPAATACFDRELRGNNLARARACLDAFAALSRDDSAIRDARRKLAARWLAVGDERLAAGELQSAGAALAAARNNDPAVPGIPEFAERLRTATASGD